MVNDLSKDITDRDNQVAEEVMSRAGQPRKQTPAWAKTELQSYRPAISSLFQSATQRPKYKYFSSNYNLKIPY